MLSKIYSGDQGVPITSPLRGLGTLSIWKLLSLYKALQELIAVLKQTSEIVTDHG